MNNKFDESYKEVMNQILMEDPDTIDTDGYYLDYEDMDAHPFVISKNEPNVVLYTPDRAAMHGDIFRGLLYQNKNERYSVYPEDTPPETLYNILEYKKTHTFGGKFWEKHVITGRYWDKETVISFWQDQKTILKYLNIIVVFNNKSLCHMDSSMIFSVDAN